MPIKDNRSNIVAARIKHESDLTSDVLVETSIIDTVDFDNGVTLVFNIMQATGTFTMTVLQVEESDDPGMAGATDVPTDNLIGTLPIITAADVPNASLNTLGVFGTKRFIRAVVNFIVDPGTASFVSWVYKTGEVKAVIHPND